MLKQLLQITVLLLHLLYIANQDVPEKILCLQPLQRRATNPGRHQKGEKVHFKKGHHTGPIPSTLIESKAKQAQSFYQRRSTLIKKAHDIAKRTECEVYIEVTRNNKTYIYGTQGKLKEHQNLVTDPSVVEVQSSNTYSEMAVVQMLEEQNQGYQVSATSDVVANTVEVETEGFPGDVNSSILDHCYDAVTAYPSPSKIMQNTEKPLTKLQAAGLACRVCSINHKSRNDRGMGRWIGCDVPSCRYWCHAKCKGLKFKTEKEAKEYKFKCPEHA